MESRPAAEVLAAIQRGAIEPVYVLHGPETYWHDAIVRALRTALLPGDDVLNYAQLDGRATLPAEAVEQARTIPFLAERRLVVVKEAAWLASRGGAAGGGGGAGPEGGRDGDGRSGAGRAGTGGQGDTAHGDEGADAATPWPAGAAGEGRPGRGRAGSSAGGGRSAGEAVDGALLEYLEDPSPTSVLVICHPPDLDGRRAVVRRLRQQGWAVACHPLRDEALARWLVQRAAAWGKELEPEAVAWLVESGEPDLQRLESEIAKVATYVGSQPRIGAADLRAVGVAVATAGVFELVDAIVAGRRRQAMELVGRLLDGNEPPLRLLALITRQYRILAYAASLRRQGADAARLQEVLQLHPFVARKAWQQARTMSPERAVAALEAVLETDVGIKQGRWPARLGLERLVWILSGIGAPGGATAGQAAPAGPPPARGRTGRGGASWGRRGGGTYYAGR
ncbi:DNA polymerase III subunit delta [Thermaerobacter litoralis]